eukprot:jgi/Bigna1/70533/fgenesh1_pg.12_\
MLRHGRKGQRSAVGACSGILCCIFSVALLIVIAAPSSNHFMGRGSSRSYNARRLPSTSFRQSSHAPRSSSVTALSGGGADDTTGRPTKRVLVTGGTGYIGSHTVVQLLESGYDVTVIDNLVNSNRKVLDRVHSITNKKPRFFAIDLCDESALDELFKSSAPFDAVIHFAGLKAVGESCSQPLRYWDNNVGGSIALLKVMERHNCTNIVFSSSATVYGNVQKVPITEDFPLQATNPYGTTKLTIETLLRDVAQKTVVGGLIGEDPNGTPNNLLPYISQVAVGRRAKLAVFGSDYDTHDGTGVRDYIHVQDLSRGHILALENAIFGSMKSNCEVYNLGTGKGYSVLDMVNAFGKACGKDIPYEIAPRRTGDVAKMFADPTKAKATELSWTASLGIDEMCSDTWRWQEKNPYGYATEQPQLQESKAS